MAEVVVPPPLRRSQRAVLGAACLLLSALPTGCGSSAHVASSTPSGSGSHAAVATPQQLAALRLQAMPASSVPIDGPPLQAGFGSVWSASSHGLVRLSLAGGRPRIVLRGPVDDVALGGCCVYALSASARRLVEFDPHTMRVRRRWKLAAGAHSVAVREHIIYVVGGGPPVSVERIDLRNGAISHTTIRMAVGVAQDRSIAVGPGAVWVIDGSSLYRLDPANLSVVGSRSLAASDIWFGDRSLWAASETPNGGVDRIDPVTDRIIAHDDSDAIQIAFTPTAVWLAAAAGPTAVNPSTARREAALPAAKVLTSGAAGIAVVGHQVWTVYSDVGKLQRIQVQRVKGR